VCKGAAATFITNDKVIRDEEINSTIFLIMLFSLYKNLIIKILDAVIWIRKYFIAISFVILVFVPIAIIKNPMDLISNRIHTNTHELVDEIIKGEAKIITVKIKFG